MLAATVVEFTMKLTNVTPGCDCILVELEKESADYLKTKEWCPHCGPVKMAAVSPPFQSCLSSYSHKHHSNSNKRSQDHGSRAPKSTCVNTSVYAWCYVCLAPTESGGHLLA
jgi:hypothetical protein